MIYVAESGVGYCKIGYSLSPIYRIADIEALTKLKFTKLMIFPCTVKTFMDEMDCHKSILSSPVIGNEWFNETFESCCESVLKTLQGRDLIINDLFTTKRNVEEMSKSKRKGRISDIAKMCTFPDVDELNPKKMNWTK